MFCTLLSEPNIEFENHIFFFKAFLPSSIELPYDDREVESYRPLKTVSHRVYAIY